MSFVMITICPQAVTINTVLSCVKFPILKEKKKITHC